MRAENDPNHAAYVRASLSFGYDPYNTRDRAYWNWVYALYRCVARLVDPRFDPRGGDPYNRFGQRAVP